MQYKLFITYMEFIIILFLLVLNGVFAMYEIALVSSSKARLETLAGKGKSPRSFFLPFKLVSRLSVLYPVLSVV